mgnify:CR=1 FL=1
MRASKPWEIAERHLETAHDRGVVGDAAEIGHVGGRLWRAKDPRVEGAMNSMADRLGKSGTLRVGPPRLDHLHGVVPIGGVRRVNRG